DPFNYNFDPLIPLGIEMVGTAMHSRLVAEGKGGSAMRSGANYSTWWNGGLRTVTYFHNMIGILTEIIGEPTPIDIPVVPEKQLPTGDWPLPVTPGKWHYRQSIDYEITNNYAILDLASRYRETFLYDIYRMGMNSIDKGSRDNWTITPKRIEALKAAAGVNRGGTRADIVPANLYASVLHDPKYRDARGYILPAGQTDFPTATKFVNALLKNGITVMQATAAFEVNGKSYPANSYVVKTAQAFRPHILDMFEPQDHPNDFQYPGGPPNRPYDITGWTLAYQMGIQFDRVLDGFEGPFRKLNGLAEPVPAQIEGPANPAGYLISHRQNDSFAIASRLLKANCAVYWMKRDEAVGGRDLGSGALWVPYSAEARRIVEDGARKLGVAAYAETSAPTGEALKLKPVRIGLYDQYGGLMPAGWTRWLFEQYELPFEVVYPQMLDAGDLKSRFDVIVFVDGAARMGGGGRGGRGGFGARIPDDIPDEYRSHTGRISQDKTIPALRKFVMSGGVVLAIGSSTALGELLGVPVSNALTEMGADGKEHVLPADKFYIPGSLLKVSVDNTNPLAYGMPAQVDVFFDNSPVFKLAPDAAQKKTSAVAWFGSGNVLDSGWAWGQQYLNGGA
ncbi:MAG TPA: hypothetical protein VG345_13000, partial [Bryobacteraceae bacterium]|nr:hypothetical protein [Bryobacteraceae bacterium]